MASRVCSRVGAAHVYTWYGVATRSNGCRAVRRFCSCVTLRLKTGEIWPISSISEWHR